MDQEKRDDRRNLRDALAGQEKRDSREALRKALQEQENAEARRNLKSDLEKQALIQGKQARIDRLLEEIKKDQNAIRNLGLYDPRDPEKRAKDFEVWTELSDKARIEFEKEFMEARLKVVEVAITESLLHGAGKAVKPVTSLNPANVSARITWLQSKGITDPYLFDAMRALARTPGKPETAKMLIDRVGKALELVITPNLSAGPDEVERSYEQMDGLAAVVGFINPMYKLAAADFRFMASSVYNSATRWESRSQIDSLSKLTEEQLKLLDKLDKHLVSHVKQLNMERRELARLPKNN